MFNTNCKGDNTPEEKTWWEFYACAPDEQTQDALLELADRYKLRHFAVSTGISERDTQDVVMLNGTPFKEAIARYAQSPDGHKRKVCFGYSETDYEEKPIDWHAFLKKADEITRRAGQNQDQAKGDAIPGTYKLFAYDSQNDHAQLFHFLSRCDDDTDRPPVKTHILTTIGWPDFKEPAPVQPQKQQSSLHGRYSCKEMGNWITFQSKTNGDSPETGWKIHLSALYDKTQTDLVELAARYKLPRFKIIRSEFFKERQDPTNKMSGRTAVYFYTPNDYDGKPIEWVKLLKDASAIIEKNGAGAIVRHDRKIPGTTGLYYRYELDRDGNYVPRDGMSVRAEEMGITKSRIYNLADKEDLLARIGWESASERTPRIR